MKNKQMPRGRWMTSEQISTTYLDFFKTRGHLELPGRSLVAPNQSTYFTVAFQYPQTDRKNEEFQMLPRALVYTDHFSKKTCIIQAFLY